MTPLLGPATNLAAASLAASAGAGPPATEEAMRVGRHFEQMFLAQMLTPMFSGLDAEGPFGGGKGEQMMRSFQIDAYAQAITARGERHSPASSRASLSEAGRPPPVFRRSDKMKLSGLPVRREASGCHDRARHDASTRTTTRYSASVGPPTTRPSRRPIAVSPASTIPT